MPIKRSMLQHKTFSEFVHWARSMGAVDISEAIAMAKKADDEIGEQLTTLLSCAAAFCATFETDDMDVAFHKFINAYGPGATQ